VLQVGAAGIEEEEEEDIPSSGRMIDAMNWKEFRRKRSWPDRITSPVFAWRERPLSGWPVSGQKFEPNISRVRF
jgi:hypothetical protein